MLDKYEQRWAYGRCELSIAAYYALDTEFADHDQQSNEEVMEGFCSVVENMAIAAAGRTVCAYSSRKMWDCAPLSPPCLSLSIPHPRNTPVKGTRRIGRSTWRQSILTRCCRRSGTTIHRTLKRMTQRSRSSAPRLAHSIR